MLWKQSEHKEKGDICHLSEVIAGKKLSIIHRWVAVSCQQGSQLCSPSIRCQPSTGLGERSERAAKWVVTHRQPAERQWRRHGGRAGRRGKKRDKKRETSGGEKLKPPRSSSPPPLPHNPPVSLQIMALAEWLSLFLLPHSFSPSFLPPHDRRSWLTFSARLHTKGATCAP